MAKKSVCKIDGCGKPHHGRGYCRAHHARSLRGSPLDAPLKTSKGICIRWIEDHKYWSGNECLTWPFARMGRGYGKIKYRGVQMGAHRAMCIEAHGEPPNESAQACHSCGKGHEACVNPRHLRWDTVSANHADKRSHGTATVGDRHGRSKLTSEQVELIRACKGRMPQREAGERFGISQTQVGRIWRGENWGAE